MTLHHCLILAVAVFSIGVYGTLTRRNIIGILLSIELMLNAANINFVSFAYFRGRDFEAGNIFPVFGIAVTTCEMAVALAIVVAMYRRHKNLDITNLEELNG